MAQLKLQRKIDENAADVNRMVQSAKYGQWDTVYQILHSKPNLINCIPEERAWAALHQAVWWKNQKAVETLLEFDSCDPLVKTKPNRSDPEGGKTPLQIAEPGSHIKAIIVENVAKHRYHRFSKDIPYKITAFAGEQMNREGLPLLLNTLYSYKASFQPSVDVTPHNNFHEIIEQIAAFEHQGKHWMHARDKIAESLHGFAQKASADLSRKNTEDEFYDEIVRMYTRNNIYRAANEALNREGKEDYSPTGSDLALGPYVLMLDVVLFFWDKLSQHSKLSYRGIEMSRNDAIKKYSVGNKFVWLQFASASKLESVAHDFGRGHKQNSQTHHAFFVIDNSTSSWWKPRDISGHSDHDEAEVLYPAGAEFEVTSISGLNEGNYTTINLCLVQPA